MTYAELNEARQELGLTIEQMSLLLGVSESTYKGWRGKDPRRKAGAPDYIAASVEAHLLLPKPALKHLMEQRGVFYSRN
jgi:transcriptional regulator with XRE-family HTH domain